MKIKLNLRPDSWNTILTLCISFGMFVYLNFYYLFSIIPAYFLFSISYSFKNERIEKINKSDMGNYFAFSLVLIIFLFLILQYPYPINTVTQSYRQTMNYDEIAELDTRGVNEVAELLKSRNIRPTEIRSHIKKNIVDYASDYEVWGISNYWATPYETLQKKSGDCEDISILTKAVSDYLNKDEEYKKQQEIEIITTKIKLEPYHIYTETNGEVAGAIDSEYTGFFDSVKEEIKDLPIFRRIIFSIGVPIILFRRKIIR